MVTAAVSRKTHGSAGDMDLDLMRSGAVECRKNGPTQVVVTFDRNLQQAGWLIYNVGVSNGTVNAAVINGNKLIIIMSGVSDASLLTIGYTVIKGTTAEAVTGTLCFGVLMGDTRTDKYVNVLDLLLIKKAINKPVTNTNFYPDINADGNINVLDLQAAKNNMNKSISGSCP
jgi:hypothetical protein